MIGEVNLKDGEYVEFGQDLENLVSGIIASSALPGFFIPESINNELYVDAGIRNYVHPIQRMIENGVEEVDIIVCLPEHINIDNTDIDTELDISDRINNVMVNEIMSNDLRKKIGKNTLQRKNFPFQINNVK